MALHAVSDLIYARFAGISHGASRTRTGDLLGAIQALSQLSYSPEGALMVAAHSMPDVSLWLS
jgi:hypothetical protein